MSLEIRLLAYAVALLFVLTLAQALVGIRAQGLPAMAGPRDSLKPSTALEGRMKRLVDNHVEGLLLFAPLVLAAMIMGVMNPWTELGARLFFYARVAHAALYMVGIPWLRTAAWAVGAAGTIIIFLALFGILA